MKTVVVTPTNVDELFDLEESETEFGSSASYLNVVKID